MCEFPSWIKDAKGQSHWLTDKDINKAIRAGVLAAPNDDPWKNATGHSAIEKVLGVKGEHMEGREGLPSGFAQDIRLGKCNKMAQVEAGEAVKNVLDLLPDDLDLAPGGVFNGSLRLGKDDVTPSVAAFLARLTSIGGDLHADAKLDLPALTSIGGNLYANAKLDLPSLKTVGGKPVSQGAGTVCPECEACDWEADTSNYRGLGSEGPAHTCKPAKEAKP